MDADTRGFVNPMHAGDEEEDAQGEREREGTSAQATQQKHVNESKPLSQVMRTIRRETLRKTPQRASNHVATLDVGQEVEVLQEAVDAAGTRRVQVRTDSGAVGWVRMAQLQPAYE